MDKKQTQLGMNPSTANGRLVKDLLFAFAVEAGHMCFRCGLPLVRENFSVEHIVPWLDSEDPIGLFFDTNNIAYSHLPCNVGAARRTYAKCGTKQSYQKGCRCDLCKEAKSVSLKKYYTTEKRRARYLKTGN